MRTSAREAAFKIIFASRFTGEMDSDLKQTLIKTDKLDSDDREYLDRVLNTVYSREKELLETVDSYSRDFPESRLFPADKSILLLALAEIKFMEDIPKVVSVNEAANIASKYSSAKSASFISGILSEIIKD